MGVRMLCGGEGGRRRPWGCSSFDLRMVGGIAYSWAGRGKRKGHLPPFVLARFLVGGMPALQTIQADMGEVSEGVQAYSWNFLFSLTVASWEGMRAGVRNFLFSLTQQLKTDGQQQLQFFGSLRVARMIREHVRQHATQVGSARACAWA